MNFAATLPKLHRPRVPEPFRDPNGGFVIFRQHSALMVDLARQRIEDVQAIGLHNGPPSAADASPSACTASLPFLGQAAESPKGNHRASPDFVRKVVRGLSGFALSLDRSQQSFAQLKT